MAQMVKVVFTDEAVQAVAGATGQATMPQTKVTVKSLAHLAAAAAQEDVAAAQEPQEQVAARASR